MKRETHTTERDWQFTDRAKRIGRGVAGAALTGVVAIGVANITNAERDTKTVPTQTEIAETGDTLWDMADDVKNVEDRREVVRWMKDNNPNLADGLDAGESVDVPLDAEDIE